MADPSTILDIPTNPCALCAGDRLVQEMPWREPSFWVTCVADGTAAGGTTVEEAVTAWNAANPPREVAPADVHAVQLSLLTPTLSPEFRATLTQAARVFAETGEAQTVDTFVAWCASLATT